MLTSANAVQFFLARCRKLDRWPRGGKPRIAAVGPATRAALEAAGLRAAFMPQAFNGAALAAELAPHLPGQRVLLPRSDRAAAELPAALRGAGADVTEVVAYRTAAPESLDALAGGMICHGEVDAVIFFSPSAVEQFAASGGKRNARADWRAHGAGGGRAGDGERHSHGGRARGGRSACGNAASVVAALERHFICVGSK